MPTQSPETEVTPAPTKEPEEEAAPEEETEETADAEEEELLEETASPEASMMPSESPALSPTPSETPEEDLFTGLPEEYSLSSADMASKKELRQYTGEMKGRAEGIDYVENEILVGAETEELAEVYAQAFNGTLKKYSGGVAVITLNADKTREEVSVADAVTASADASMRLPAAWPNYYYYLDTEAEGEEQEAAELAGAEEDAQSAVVEADDTYIYKDPSLTETDAYYQWHHAAIGSKQAWYLGYTGKSVKVAVVDSGVVSHEDLTVTEIDWWDEMETGDTVGHGTHVAGIIGALGNGTGVIGVAPEATSLVQTIVLLLILLWMVLMKR